MHLHGEPLTTRRTGATLVVLAGLLIAETTVRADAPLIDDGRLEIESRNKQFVASPGPKGKSTLVFRRVLGAKADLLWQMPRWLANPYLSDDGECMVDAYVGVNLVPLHYDRDQVMMTFYKTGKLVGTVRLRELIRDFSHLKRSVSNYTWGDFTGFVSPNRFAVDTVEERRLEFDATTGKLVADEPSPKPSVQTSDDALPEPPPKERKKSPRPVRHR